MQASFSFFGKKRFLPLFTTQFLGALNDNLLKTAVIVLISYHGLSFMGLQPELMINLAALLFILPYFIFSASAGRLSEKIDKALLARRIKQAEILIMVLAAYGFWSHTVFILLLSIFLMGVHSTFFGPLKYSALPQYLADKELVAGNGLIEMGTFLAILIGQIAGSLLVETGSLGIISLCASVAILGYLSSRSMPDLPPSNPELQLSFNVVKDTKSLLHETWQLDQVKAAILGISWFWFMGAIYTTQLPEFTKLQLGGNAQVYTFMLTLFSVGIGLGSIVCAKISQGKIQLGLVLWGSLGMSVASIMLALLNWQSVTQLSLNTLGHFISDASHFLSFICLFSLGFFGGFFTVPLYSYLQTQSPENFRSQAIAANNIINGLYMLSASVLAIAVLSFINNTALLYLLVGLLNLPFTLLLIKQCPMVWTQKFNLGTTN